MPARGSTLKDWSESKVLRVMRMCNVLNGIGLIATGIIVFFVGIVDVSFSEVTVAGYIVCVRAAVLLFASLTHIAPFV